MFLLSNPTDENVRHFIESQKGKTFSYGEVGATRNKHISNAYTIDHNRVQLGTGRATFDCSVKAIKNWKMFDLPWVRICFEDTPVEGGRTVAILIKHFGFWSLNAAQIVYVLDETTNDIEKFGFAYGTLKEHGERGEERFTVEYHRADKSVWYDLYAFSQPNHILAKIGYPFSRYLQKQFASESKAAMQRAVQK